MSKGLNFTRYPTVPINAINGMLVQCVKRLEFLAAQSTVPIVQIAPTVVTTG